MTVAEPMHRAIQEALPKEREDLEGCMVSRFIVVAEVITKDGDRNVDVSVSEGMRMWDVIGLLEYAKQDANVQMMFRCECDDEEGG